MKVIHQGTVVQTRLALVDDEGNVVQEVVIGPRQDAQQDPLLLRSLKEEAFLVAQKTVIEAKLRIEQQIQEQLEKTGQVQTINTEQPPEG